MTLLSPVMLWAMAALVPLAAIYFLKVRPTRKQVTTLFLWEQLVHQTRSSALLRRLRDLLSLFIMAIAIASLCMAMARPVLYNGKDDRDLILLIDNSLSMNAVEGGMSRLELAKEAARDILGAMSGQRRAAVAIVAKDVRYLVNLTDNQRALTQAVDRIQPSHLSLRKDALDSVSFEQIESSRSRVIFISDGCFQGVGQLGDLELLKIGAQAENIGLTRFDMLRLPGSPTRLGLFFELASSFQQDKKLDVILCYDDEDNVVKVCPVTVKPGVNQPEVFTVDHDSPGRWILKIELHDSLAVDNVAYAVLPEHKPIRAAVNAESGRFFLSRCVEAFSQNDQVMTLVQTDPEIVLANGSSDTQVAGQIIFHPEGDSPFWQNLGQPTDGGAVNVLAPEHPAVRLCNLEMLDLVGQRQITPPIGSLVLATSDDGVPLIYKAYHRQQSAYVINIDPAESEFFLSVYFPIMVYSMAVDLTDKSPQRNVSSPPGSVLYDPMGKASQKWTMTDPHGQTGEYHPGQPVRMDKLGFYALKNDSSAKLLACSQAGRAESLLDNSNVAHTAGPLPRHVPPSTVLIVLALLLVTVESVLYHRRKVG